MNMPHLRGLLFAAALFCALCGAAERPVFDPEPRLPRRIAVGPKPVLELVKGGKVNFEIVVPKKATPSAKFAAAEVSSQLGEAFGTELPLLAAPSGKCPALIFGDAELAAKMGIEPSKFDRDGFVIKSLPGKKGVLIIGKDHPTKDPVRQNDEHATVFGAYDFLERFAGIRYYLPGKIGTLIPKRQAWRLPEIDIYDRPAFVFRNYADSFYPRSVYEGADFTGNFPRSRSIAKLRTRCETRTFTSCHGLRDLGLQYRFGKSHPEYFALKTDGTRYFGSGKTQNDQCHLCFSSDVSREIALDAISYLREEPASVRGVRTWRNKIGWHSIFKPGNKMFSISPNDGCYKCSCPQCKPVWSKGKKAVSTHMWRFFGKVAQQVKDSGTPGFVTVPVYSFWRELPDVELPDNILLDVAIRGPWNELSPGPREEQMDQLKSWTKKLGIKAWLWTYPGKYDYSGPFPGIPIMTPRYAASFTRRVKPYAIGFFHESVCEKLALDYLSKYVYGKLMWDPDLDIEALLAEHHERMFGPAAKQMQEFFDTIERNWMKIASQVVETPLGPKTVYPSDLELWNEIYSPAVMARLGKLFDESEKLTAKTPEYLERVKFMRREIFGELKKASDAYHEANSAVKHWRAVIPETKSAPRIDGVLDDPAWRNANVLTLAPLRGTPAEVRTTVKVMHDKENFYFGFDCEEPAPKLRSVPRKFDDHSLWHDAGVEVFLSPDRHPVYYYQLMVNASGSLADLHYPKFHDWRWNSGAEVKCRIIPGKGWTAEIRLPKKSLGKIHPEGILANFTRRRNAEGVDTPTKTYCWGPFVRDHNDVQRYGTLSFAPLPERENSINNCSFEKLEKPSMKDGRYYGLWHIQQKAVLQDPKAFVTGFCSARIDGPDGGVLQHLPRLKPDTEYRLSFYMKLDGVKKIEPRFSGFFVRLDDYSRKEQYFPSAALAFDGTCPWRRVEYRFKTSAVKLPGRMPRIWFVMRHTAGSAWIDQVELTEAEKSGQQTRSVKK